jgi:putative MATE family efflux protein
VVIGVLVTLPCLLAARPLVRAVGAHGAVVDQGTTYLRIAVLGVTPLLVMLAATGVLRGLQDTRTPLLVAVGANGLNVVLNLLLVYGVGPFDGWGVAGSAAGSVLAQALAAATLAGVVVRGARRHGAPLRPDLTGIRQAARAGVPLVVRTLTLRAALLVTTYAVTLVSLADQDAQLAAHQIAFTVWTFLAFVLDAIAIAAQALTGRSLGAADVAGTRAITARMVWWGVVSGIVTGVALAAASPFVGALFTGDDRVRNLLVPVLLVVAVAQPVCGVVFVLDGVLIGAGDGRYLAWGGVVTLLVYAPVVLLLHPTLVAVWIAFSAVFMGARLVVLVHRARRDAWLVTGVATP